MWRMQVWLGEKFLFAGEKKSITDIHGMDVCDGAPKVWKDFAMLPVGLILQRPDLGPNFRGLI